MKKQLRIELQQDTYQRLLNQFQGDEQALNKFILDLLNKTSEMNLQDPAINLDASGLKEYLQSSQQRSREYGAKGEGW